MITLHSINTYIFFLMCREQPNHFFFFFDYRDMWVNVFTWFHLLTWAISQRIGKWLSMVWVKQVSWRWCLSSVTPSLQSNLTCFTATTLDWCCFQTSLPLATLQLCYMITACHFRVTAFGSQAALASSLTGITPELNRIQLSLVCHRGQSGRVIDLLARLLAACSTLCSQVVLAQLYLYHHQSSNVRATS